MSLVHSGPGIDQLGRGRHGLHRDLEEAQVADQKTADKDTYVDDPTRPGVQVFVKAGDPLPVFVDPATGSKAVEEPAENKARSQSAKK